MNRTPPLLRSPNRRPRQRQTGFSLIELMVALTLGLIIVGGVISIFVANQQAFRTTAALGRLQENARISFELMAREVRQSGGNACGTPLVRNLLRNTNWSSNWDAGAIVGYAGETNATDIKGFGTDPVTRVEGTDAVKVLGSAIGFAAGIKSHNADNATIELTSTFSQPATVVACDGKSAVIARFDGGTGTAANPIRFTTTENCVTGFDFTSACTPLSSVERTLASDGFVAPLSASFWYIGHNARNGGKSLYRVGLNGAEEIAENVVGMEIRYLLRNESTGALDTDWVAASAVSDWTTDAPKQLAALRFTLQLETLDKVGTNQKVITRELIHVVNLRNRLD